jgi:hypothetical protein
VRKFGIVMMVLQIITTVFLFPLFFIGGPVIWFFWWVAFKCKLRTVSAAGAYTRVRIYILTCSCELLRGGLIGSRSPWSPVSP